MTSDDRLKKVLAQFEFEPTPTQAGETAGSRSAEGREFGEEMRKLLARPGFVIETAVAKSSDGRRLDGNASERVSYKMLRFKRHPLNRNRTLVVALNVAFEKYDNPQLGELREQAAFLNGLDLRGQILLLSRKEHYEYYLRDISGEET
ncbi:MAG: hypothetical protein IPH07_37535 [Deltaproteobacteria bacterium]|nr:hypothetical protein [Deltaproteobacteria bacterium]MBK8713529.1 hypothetical protein [Deltaproteobacteria bacterium]MBP7289931.1 hypothetical protein [Nannocystaceae bacterium]